MKSGMAYKQILSMSEYRAAKDEAAENPEKQFRAGTGAESVRELLQNINLDEEAEALHAIVSAPGQGAKKVRAIKRLDIVEAFRKSGNRPEWMITHGAARASPPICAQWCLWTAADTPPATFNELLSQGDKTATTALKSS